MRQRGHNHRPRPREYSREYYDYSENLGYRNHRPEPRRDRSGRRKAHTPNYQRQHEKPYQLFANRREGAWRSPQQKDQHRDYRDPQGQLGSNQRRVTPDRTKYFDSRDRNRSYEEKTPRNRSQKNPFLAYNGRPVQEPKGNGEKQSWVWYNRDGSQPRADPGWRHRGRELRSGRQTERGNTQRDLSFDYASQQREVGPTKGEWRMKGRGRSATDGRSGLGVHGDDQRPHIVRYGRNGQMAESVDDHADGSNPIKRRFSNHLMLYFLTHFIFRFLHLIIFLRFF